ncbi:hypothetical protein AALP_AAs54961U000100, partial [Arabis alpina]
MTQFPLLVNAKTTLSSSRSRKSRSQTALVEPVIKVSSATTAQISPLSDQASIPHHMELDTPPKQASVSVQIPRSDTVPVTTVHESTIHEQPTLPSLGQSDASHTPIDSPTKLNLQAPSVEAGPSLPQVNTTTLGSGLPQTPHVPTTPKGANPPPSKAWAEVTRHLDDNSLHSVTTPTISANGVPRVKIPNAVFARGAEAHKEFLVGYFLGKPPPVGLIQSVINHMWGRGKKIEVHVDYLARSMLVRLPNDHIRQKVLEKKYWHIDTSMFIIVPRSTPAASVPSELVSLPLWAHVTGIPFDLRTQWGLSHVGDALGMPQDVDDFTKNLVSLSVAHIRVIADLSKPLPTSLELERDDGQVITCEVSYPWVPPSCSHCKKLGHNIRYCPQVSQKWVPISKAKHGIPATKEPAKGTPSKLVDLKGKGVSPVGVSVEVLHPISEVNGSSSQTTSAVNIDSTPASPALASGTTSVASENVIMASPDSIVPQIGSASPSSPMVDVATNCVLALPVHLKPTQKVRVSEATHLLEAAQVRALNSPSTPSFQAEKDAHDQW